METGKIYKAIPAVMKEINAVGKNKKNAQQGFMYRGVDDVMNAINPALVKNSVFIVPEIIEQTRESRTTNRGATLMYSICKMSFKFYADDGSYIEAVTIGEGMDSGDKATNKAMAVAFKYACFQVFCIPTEEMKDPDADSYDKFLTGKPSDVHKEMEACRGLRITLADIGSKKGGSKNEPFMKKWNELFPGGFKDVNDKELLEKAVETLSQIPDYDAWQAELAKNKEETEETNKEEKVNE